MTSMNTQKQDPKQVIGDLEKKLGKLLQKAAKREITLTQLREDAEPIQAEYTALGASILKQSPHPTFEDAIELVEDMHDLSSLGYLQEHLFILGFYGNCLANKHYQKN